MNGGRAALNSWKMRWRLITQEGNAMKNKALAVQSIQSRQKTGPGGASFLGSLRPPPRIEASVRPANRRWFVTSRTCLILVLFLELPAALWAQKQQGSWSDLRGLKVGQGIEVI